MSASIEHLISDLQEPCRDLIQVANYNRLQPRLTSTLRTFAEQKRLRQRWEAGLSPYFAAPPGESPHEWGFAFDMVVTPLNALAWLGQVWESWGGYWGGHQSDPVHFQYPGFAQYKAANPLVDPSGNEETGIGSVFAWVNSLPWWVQLALPLSSTSQKVSPDRVTVSYLRSVLQSRGIVGY